MLSDSLFILVCCQRKQTVIPSQLAQVFVSTFEDELIRMTQVDTQSCLFLAILCYHLMTSLAVVVLSWRVKCNSSLAKRSVFLLA